MRLHLTLVFFVLTSIGYSQKSSLFQNINERANELKHGLNKSGDSITFKCERTIFEVAIFKGEFERVNLVKKNKAEIYIGDLPVGRYIVEVLLRDKLIVVTLLRNEAFELREVSPIETSNTNLIAIKKPPKEEGKIVVAKEKAVLAVAGKKPKPLTRKVVRKRRPKPIPEVKTVRVKKAVTTYWVVYIMNKGTSTEKTQKLGDQGDINRIIKKIEIDKKTKTGRLNELTIWTVYDSSEFLVHKRKNKKNYMNIASESFKMEPYYEKLNK